MVKSASASNIRPRFNSLIGHRFYQTKIILNLAGHVASGGAFPPRFSFFPLLPIYFLPSHGIFMGGKSCCFWPEKPFEFVISARKSLWISAKTFFCFCFWRSPDFHLNFALIRFRDNECLGQVQRWFSALTL